MQLDHLSLAALIELRRRINALIRSKLTPEVIAENREVTAGFLEAWRNMRNDRP